jgi:ACS family hexuronate transporter-like MFS transporter
LIGKGFGAGRARLTAMVAPAFFMPGAILAYYTEHFPLCVAFVTLATACHQAWSANLFTSATDLFPAKVSGSVVGLGATTGGIGGMFMTLLSAMVIQWTGNQQAIFIWAGLMHPISWLLLRFWLGKDFKRVQMDKLPDLTQSFRPLLLAGAAVIGVGIVAALAIVSNWHACVAQVRLPGAAQAITAATGVVLLGIALLYAGAPRRNTVSSA